MKDGSVPQPNLHLNMVFKKSRGSHRMMVSKADPLSKNSDLHSINNGVMHTSFKNEHSIDSSQNLKLKRQNLFDRLHNESQVFDYNKMDQSRSQLSEIKIKDEQLMPDVNPITGNLNKISSVDS